MSEIQKQIEAWEKVLRKIQEEASDINPTEYIDSESVAEQLEDINKFIKGIVSSIDVLKRFVQIPF